MPQDGESRSPYGQNNLDELIRELAKVFCLPEEAVHLARRAGFPAFRMPSFTTPQVFWSAVVEKASNGVLPLGVQSIVEEARSLFPYNMLFDHFDRSCSNRILYNHQNEGGSRSESHAHVSIIKAKTARILAETEAIRQRADDSSHESVANIELMRAKAQILESVDTLINDGRKLVLEDDEEGNVTITITIATKKDIN